MPAKCSMFRSCLLMLIAGMAISAAGALAQSNPSNDPRLADFKGRIGRTYQESVED